MSTEVKTIPMELHSKRLDQALAVLWPDYSRAQHQAWLEAGKVLLNGEPATKRNLKVETDQALTLTIESEIKTELVPQDVDFGIEYEDDDILIVNKPVGLVVHPGAGVPDGTLVNGLLHHCPALAELPRAGLVHRIDKDTSGLLIVGKTLIAYNKLVEQLKNREIHRQYHAIVQGHMIAGRTIEANIGRHGQHRTKMAVTHNGKPAVTHVRVLQKFEHHSYLSCELETGRTHQIRVHLHHIHYPIVGDKTYGSHRKFKVEDCMHRQALHAKKISLAHPTTGEELTVECELPKDMQHLLEELCIES